METEHHQLEIRLLGAVEVVEFDDQRVPQPVSIGGRIQRRILAALAAARPDVVPVDRLVDITWADEPPARADHNVRTYVSRLRSVVGGGATIEQVGDGYRILLTDAVCDLDQFEQLVDATERLRSAGAATDALASSNRAEGLWRGQPFGEFAFEPWAQPDVARLEERRNAAAEVRAELLLATGRHNEAITHLQTLVAEHPLRESPRALLMRALYASGRTTEALRVFQQYRSVLGSEVGLDPSSELVELDQSIARGDHVDAGAALKVGGFVLHERIGAGAFGTVHRATQTALDREVAIKIIRTELATEPSFVRAFEREARLVARLEHDAIVPLYDFWRDPDQAYLVMRYLPGGSLADLLSEHALTLDQTMAVIERVASALSAAHRANVIHRDVKPANILFDSEGRAVLGDFGIAIERPIHASPGEQRVSESSARFAAPEQLRGEPLDQRADVYSLALVAWTILANRSPFAHLSSQDVVEAKIESQVELESIVTIRPDLPSGLSEVIDLAVHVDPTQRPVTVDKLVDRMRSAISTAPGATAARPAAADLGENPYQGLLAFDEASARHFHGRRTLVDELASALTERRLVTVVGASGSGKSSVVRAGLLPALHAGAIAGSQDWFVTSMTPGSRPFEALETAALRVAVNPPGELLSQLTSDERGLARAVERLLPERDGRLLLVIDQFEELFTSADPLVANRFLDAISTALNEPDGRLRVVATLRGDFYDRPLRHRGFAPLLKASTVAVTPLAPAELEQVIVEPARSVGAGFEPGLVARIMADATDQPGSLALLEYALTLAFDHSDGRTITAADYENVGGIEGALVGQAERLHDSLEADGRAALRRVMGALVALGEGTEDTRRRALRSELGETPAVDQVIEAFSRNRLFTLDHDPATREPTVEVAHETLIRAWPRLRDWLDEDRDDLRLERHLTAASSEWVAAGHAESELYRGGRLEAAVDWRNRAGATIAPDAQSFLDQSVELADAEARAEAERLEFEQRSNRRLRRSLAGVAVLLAMAMVAGGLAFQQRQAAQDTAYDAETGRLVATAQSLADTNPQAALLLAVAAHQREQTPETLGALQVALVRSGPQIGSVRGTSYVDLVWLSTGRIVAAHSDGLDLIDSESMQIIDSVSLAYGDFAAQDRFRLAAGSDGEVLVGHDGNRVTLFDTSDGFVEQVELPPSFAPVFSVDISPAGYLVTAAADGRIAAFDSEGEMVFDRRFVVAASLAEQAEPQLGSDFPFFDLFDRSPVQVAAFANEDQLVVVVGAEVHRIDWSGQLEGSTFLVIRPRVSDPPHPFPSGVPALGLTDVTTFEDRIVVLMNEAVGLLETSTVWPATVYAEPIGTTQGGAPDAAAVVDLGANAPLIRNDLGAVLQLDLSSGVTTVLDAPLHTTARQVTPSPDGSAVAAIAGDELLVTSTLGGNVLSTAIDRDPRAASLSLSLDASTIAMSGSAAIVPFDLRQRQASGAYEQIQVSRSIGTLARINAGGDVLRTFHPDGLGVDFYALVDDQFEFRRSWASPIRTNVGANTRDLSLLAVGNGSVLIFRELSLEPERELLSPTNEEVPLNALRFSPDERFLLASWRNGRSQIWSTETWQVIDTPAVNESDITVGFWSLDGSLIATTASTGLVTIRDGSTFEPIRTLAGNIGIGSVNNEDALLFSPDNRYLLTTVSGPSRLWHVASGQQVGEAFPNLAGVFPGANHSENGLQLITGSERGALVWNLNVDEWPGIACRAAGRELTEAEWAQWGPRDEPYRELCTSS